MDSVLPISTVAQPTDNKLDLAQRVINGEQKAQREMFNLLAPKLFTTCLRYASCEDEAKDFMQEAFIRIFDKLQTFKGESSLFSWCNRVTINLILRKISKKVQFTDLTETAETIEDANSEDEIDFPKELEKVINAMQQLAPGFRTVLNLYAIEKKSHDQIAEMLGITTSTSRTQLLKARKALKLILGKGEKNG